MSALVLILDDATPVERWATLSEDRRYRYDLGRRWSSGGRALLWVMLNPSVGDADRDDHTLRRCMTLARSWEYDEMAVVNLYALRSSDPAVLGKDPDPFGPENAAYLDRHLADASTVVAAWGAHPFASAVSDDLLRGFRPLYCAGTTKAGHPRHPSRLPGSPPLTLWRS